MKTFKTFLSECGVDDVDELILFLNNLPDSPEAMVHIPGIERFKKQIDMVFGELDEEAHGSPYIWQLSEKAVQLIGGSEVFDE